MPIKKENSVLQITITPFHKKKLAILRERTGLNNTGIVQRLIENHEMFELSEEGDVAPPEPTAEEDS